MTNEALLLAIAPAMVTGLISYYAAVRKSKSDAKLMVEQNELDIAGEKRKTAQEYLIRKEFSFYEETDKLHADLVVAVQDVCESITGDNGLGLKNRQDIAHKNITILLDHYITLKALVLTANPYLPKYISSATTDAITIYNNEIKEVCEGVSELIKGNTIQKGSKEYERISSFQKSFLWGLSGVEVAKRKRLSELLG